MPSLAYIARATLPRNIRAFLYLRAGIVRDGLPKSFDEYEKELAKAREQILRLQRQIRRQDSGIHSDRITPEQMIWMFGYARTGSSWLGSMMNDMSQQTTWHEPFVGQLFGLFYENWRGEGKSRSKHFILGPPEGTWPTAVRNFVLERASSNFSSVKGLKWLVVKEPNGSIGAPLLMKALPESRLLFLIRDPRDVTASRLDAFREGSWLYKSVVERGSGRTGMFAMDQDALLKNTAEEYLLYVGRAKEAFDAHDGPKVLVRYEELVENTLTTMLQMYRDLQVEIDEDELERIIDKHSWSNIPESEKGTGKFYRKGKVGSWHEDLTPEQARVVEKITEPIISEYYG